MKIECKSAGAQDAVRDSYMESGEKPLNLI